MIMVVVAVTSKGDLVMMMIESIGVTVAVVVAAADRSHRVVWLTRGGKEVTLVDPVVAVVSIGGNESSCFGIWDVSLSIKFSLSLCFPTLKVRKEAIHDVLHRPVVGNVIEGMTLMNDNLTRRTGVELF